MKILGSIFATKLIKHLAITSCQAVNPRTIKDCFDSYTLWKQYHNSYLTIDHPEKEKKKMNNLCISLSDALQSKFDTDVNIFVSKKKKLFIYRYTSL